MVVGAGAAGLAAAAELGRAGRSALVLEARERIGGRCWTRAFPGLPVPVELGAEFIHGRAAVTFALLEKAGAAAIDSAHRERTAGEGRRRAVDAFAEAQKAMRNTAALKAKDLSFSAYLARQRLSARTRSYARMMVEGFDAADPARASARAIVEEWNGGAQLGAQFRPLGGYAKLLEFLAQGARIQLQTTVRSLRWKAGAVEAEGELRGRAFSVKARRAIVTLPIGVLQSNAVRFTPALEEKRPALRKLVAGPVVKIALRFHSAFWEARDPDVGFFHSTTGAFPTFWTALPLRAPLLIGWAGGPKADRLAGASEKVVLREAMKSLGSIFGRVPASELAAFFMHDWQADPFARGAYSYVAVGGQGARELLRQPLAETLYFAGEATDTEGEAGTVAGALQSGMRAARELLEGESR